MRHVTFLLLAVGCVQRSETLCDTRAAASVQVAVTTSDGAVPEGLSLVYRVGGDAAARPCDDLGDGTWVCGWEVAGSLEVTVTADGYAPVTRSVDVGSDACHVETESLDVTLDPELPMCTGEMVPSVAVTVQDSSGVAVPDAVVTYAAMEHGVSGACTAAGDAWACGHELDGIVRVRAEADGFEAQEAEVDVQSDACHVLTEDVTLTLPTLDEVCTGEVVQSVDVIVSTRDATIPTGTWATYHAVDANVRGDCTAWSDTHLMCGEELAGTFEVTVGAAGYLAQVATVEVEADVCHVVPELLQVTLDLEVTDIVCTDVMMPSVIVNVSSASDATVPLAGVAVTYAVGAEAAEACESFVVGTWQCGLERAGDVTLYVSADGHLPATRTVTVGADACHVITETVDVVLEPQAVP